MSGGLLTVFSAHHRHSLHMAREALIDNNIIGIFRNSPFVYGNISTHICSRNMAASVAINITA